MDQKEQPNGITPAPTTHQKGRQSISVQQAYQFIVNMLSNTVTRIVALSRNKIVRDGSRFRV
jgi:hypothetical protein